MDWTALQDPGVCIENVVAMHLIKACHVWSDIGFGTYELCYWRDRNGTEVDFIITENTEPVVAIECKRSSQSFSKSLESFGRRLPEIPLIQLVDVDGVDHRRGRRRIVDAKYFLASLP